MNGRLTATHVPADHHRSRIERSGSPILEPLQEQRHQQQRGVELRGRAEPEEHARPPVAAAGPRHQRAGGTRDRREVPVECRVDQQRRGKREPQRPPSREQPQAPRDEQREPEHQDRVRIEEAAVAVLDPRLGAHQVHREHRVLVAVVLALGAGVEEGQPSPGELLGAEEWHDVRVTQVPVLPAVAVVPARAGRLGRGAEGDRADGAGEHQHEADAAGGVPHAAHRIRAVIRPGRVSRWCEGVSAHS